MGVEFSILDFSCGLLGVVFVGGGEIRLVGKAQRGHAPHVKDRDAAHAGSSLPSPKAGSWDV
jgi:hypothetical protein